MSSLAYLPSSPTLFNSGTTRAQLSSCFLTTVDDDLHSIFGGYSNNAMLAKVAITGGGRCNLTNSFALISDARQAYPRGHKLMKRLLKRFSHTDVYDWFEREGVPLVTQSDECVFPASQDSQSIISCLTRLAVRLGVRQRCGNRLTDISRNADSTLHLTFANGFEADFHRVAYKRFYEAHIDDIAAVAAEKSVARQKLFYVAKLAVNADIALFRVVSKVMFRYFHVINFV